MPAGDSQIESTHPTQRSRSCVSRDGELLPEVKDVIRLLPA